MLESLFSQLTVVPQVPSVKKSREPLQSPNIKAVPLVPLVPPQKTKVKIIEELKHEQTANSTGVLTALDKKIVLAWLNHIGEKNPVMIEDVLNQCANDGEALAYYLKRSLEVTKSLTDLFDDRHFCRECQNLNWQGRCTASKTRYSPVDTHPRRCVDFVEAKR